MYLPLVRVRSRVRITLAAPSSPYLSVSYAVIYFGCASAFMQDLPPLSTFDQLSSHK